MKIKSLKEQEEEQERSYKDISIYPEVDFMPPLELEYTNRADDIFEAMKRVTLS